MDLAVLQLSDDVECNPPSFAPRDDTPEESPDRPQDAMQPCQLCGRPCYPRTVALGVRTAVQRIVKLAAPPPNLAYLRLGDATRVQSGDPMCVAAWPTPEAQQTIYLDRGALLSM